MTFYDFILKDGDGFYISTSSYKGNVVLVVNTATECGFTPQYKELQAMYRDFHDRGFEIIDIPSNQFKGQAPGTNKEIQQFCELTYHTEFPQLAKSDVNGAQELPLYTFLKQQKGFKGFGIGPKSLAMAGLLKMQDPNYKNNADIKWNFTKFLVDREGNVVERFEPTIPMDKVRDAVEALL
ncbi:glutathione peroxidase [Peptoniphilus equinus]